MEPEIRGAPVAAAVQMWNLVMSSQLKVRARKSGIFAYTMFSPACARYLAIVFFGARLGAGQRGVQHESQETKRLSTILKG